MITVLILGAAIAVLGWGFYRARPFGKLGILAWLQSVALMAPWLLFFGLFAVGVYLNLAGVLLLLVLSAAVYITLGRQLRAAGADAVVNKKFAPMASTDSSEPSSDDGPTVDIAPSREGRTPEAQDPDVMPIPDEDLQAIKGIFGIDTFFVTETIPYQNGAILRGNLRGEVEPSLARLTASLKERVGDRYRLFLVEGPDGKPTCIILPSSSDPQPVTSLQLGLAVVLAIATIATSLEASGLLLGFDFFNNINRFQEALPFALGIVTVLAIHELGHWVTARRYGMRLSPPFFIPTWQIGAFGALTRFASVLPSRTVLFDVAFAGPAAGGLLSLALLIVGLLLSHPGSYFQLPSEFFLGSVLVGALSKIVLGSAVQQPIVDVHPLMVLGWLGLVITALNLMPAGQLDGGRIIQSIYGRKVAGRTTLATLVVLGLAALVNPLALYWAILILVLQRDLERPALNELSEPDDARAALGLLALFLMAATLLPLTPSLAGRLGIGG